MSFKLISASIVTMVLLAFVPAANAQATGQAGAGSSVNIAQFPNGGSGLIARVRDALTANKSELSPLINLWSAANKDQQDAIANGLVQAANSYLRTDPACAPGAPPSAGTCFGTQIQQAVANSNIPDFIKAYASIAGDSGTASTGGGGGGGGGGQTGNNTPNGGQNSGINSIERNFIPNSFTNLITGGSAGGASSNAASETR